ncbi:hypothetical protein [Pedobacter psychrophilus]|nr:hypothetical protein [Pedobacter psychrophilus]
MKIVKFLMVPAMLLSLQTMAQTKTSTEGKVGKTINKVGNKTAQVAVKGTAVVADKKYDGKVSANGQTVYINKYDHYYWVDAKGKKVYVTKASLKNAPKH